MSEGVIVGRALMPDIKASAINGRPTTLSCIGGDIEDATPTPTLPRCGRWRVLRGRGRFGREAEFGALSRRIALCERFANRYRDRNLSAPSLAGRSPQRGRVGVGGGNIVDEAEFWFFTFAAIILALFCFASNACCCCAGCSSPTGKGSISAVFHHICSSIYRGRCALSCIGGDFKDATPSPTLPRCGLRPAGEGVVRRISPHPFTDSFTYT